MALSPKTFLGKKKERKEREKESRIQEGFTLGEISMNPLGHSDSHLCMSNALMNFVIVYGTISCLLVGIDIKWNRFLIMMVLLTTATIMSFFYYNRWYRLVGYVVFTGGILLALQQKLLYFRSGFAILCNGLMHVLEEELQLPMEREYEVYVENTGLAVTMCLILLGVVMELFFNIIISELKNCWIVLLFSFPLVQLPFYLNCDVQAGFLWGYFGGIVSIYMIRIGGHYRIVPEKQKDFQKIRLGKKEYRTYRTDGVSSEWAVMEVIAFVILANIILIRFWPNTDYDRGYHVESEWKESTKQFAKRFALVGFWGMFSDDGQGAGGVGTSKLGTISRVRMDFEPDLYLYLNKSETEHEMYLRGYSGREYRDNEWSIDPESETEPYCAHFQPADEFLLLDEQDQKVFAEQRKQVVLENVGAGRLYSYLPYWNVTGAEHYQEDSVRGVEPRLLPQKTARRTYFVKQNLTIAERKQKIALVEQGRDPALWEDFRKREEVYRSWVYDNYLQIDAEQKQRLLSLLSQQGILPGQEDAPERVRDFLTEQYVYTLMPGATPEGKDFVDYFLFEQKKGYCVYFASAATLLYRSLGIPARYVCGYVASYDEFSNAKRMDSSYGLSPEEGEICRVSVTDANAHAWVELYLDGFGWVMMEVTNAPVEEVEEEKATYVFWQLLGGWFGSETTEVVNKTARGFFTGVLAGALLTLLFSPAVLFIIWEIRRRRFQKGFSGKALPAMFSYLIRMAVLAGISFPAGCTYRRMGELISERFGAEAEAGRLVELMEQAVFSNVPVTAEEQQWYYLQTRQLSKRMLSELPCWKRLFLGTIYRI